MKKRLIWNFEIINDTPLDLPTEVAEGELETRPWEVRCFGDENNIMTLQGLDDSFLNLNHCKIKKRRDTYYLLPDQDYNVKRRRLELFYKPLIKKDGVFLEFGKKINLAEYPAREILPGNPPISAEDLLKRVHMEGVAVSVEKTALIFKFPDLLGIRLELARFTLGDNVFFSACLESSSQQWVRLLGEQILPLDNATDYVNFLKKNTPFPARQKEA
jgi:hypothetical protein